MGDGLLFRLFHLSTIMAGLMQKPCALHAWDVQWTHLVLDDVRRRGGSAAFLGTTLIVLRMVYAKVGQETVGKLAATLQRAGRTWDQAAVRELLAALGKLDREDAGRSRSRLVQNSGPHWCRKVLRMRQFCRLQRAGEALGRILRGPAVAGDPSVLAGAFEALNSAECRLPGFGKYCRTSAIRMACSSRLLFDDVRVVVDAATWSRRIRAERKDNVAAFLDAVGVVTLDDAWTMSSGGQRAAGEQQFPHSSQVRQDDSDRLGPASLRGHVHARQSGPPHRTAVAVATARQTFAVARQDPAFAGVRCAASETDAQGLLPRGRGLVTIHGRGRRDPRSWSVSAPSGFFARLRC